jgi:TonB family protein
MFQWRLYVRSLILSFVSASLFPCLIAQEIKPNEMAAQIALTDLYPPLYPPLARQARIMGDVQIKLSIRNDGSIASAEVVSGHPLLQQSALESAQKSKFTCSDCTQDLNSYSLTFTFGFRNDGDCGCRRLRSSKCLGLWKCGSWRCSQQRRPPVVGQSLNRVVILEDLECVNTTSSSSPPRE